MSKPELNQEVDINEDVADMSEAILRVAEAGEALLKSGLTEKAIVLLLQARIGTPTIRKSDIENVLWAIPRLKDYLK